MLCSVCKTDKDIDEFSLDRSKKSGRCSTCKPCASKRSCSWAKKNPEKHNENGKFWAVNNPESVKESNKRAQLHTKNERADKKILRQLLGENCCVECDKPLSRRNKSGFCKKHRHHSSASKMWFRTYTKERKATDVNFKLATRLRGRISKALKSGSAIDDLGCTIPELKAYLEKRFKPGMTWGNWSLYGWHLDHIKALISFDLTDPVQFKQATNYTNLQPLWAIEHYEKTVKDKRQVRDG